MRWVWTRSNACESSTATIWLDHLQRTGAASDGMSALHLGTCSWKYPSWRGLVYSDAANPNYLQGYAQRYDAIEIDQWFWSLYGPDKVVLPQSKVVAEYVAAVPEGFRFGVKLPNALTLTLFHQAAKTDPLVPNPHFLSMDVLRTFLDRLEPMRDKLGPLMFQFGYLNKLMIPSQADFLDKLGAFVNQMPTGHTWAVEARNPNHLNAEHFGFLWERGLAHVFQQGLCPADDRADQGADGMSGS